MHMRSSPKTLAALVSLFAISAIPSTAKSQTPTTEPAASQAAPDVDLNQMAENALELLDIGTEDAKNEAARITDTLRKIAPQFPKTYLLSGKMCSVAGQGPNAIRYYEVYKNTPDGKLDHRPYADLGRIYMRSKSYRNAKRNLEDACTYAPPEKVNGKYIRAEIMMDLATVLHELKDDAEAIRKAREAATQAKDDPRIQILFSRLLLEINPTETKACRDAVAPAIAQLINVDLAEVPFNSPKLQLLREALAVVETTWVREVGMQSQNPEPAHMLSLATQDVAEISLRLALIGAREYEAHALELNKNKVEYKIRLAEIDAMLGSTRTAKDLLDEVLKDDPKNKDASDLLKRINSTTPRKIGVAAGL